jgi:glutamyl-tRNA(Gln) amidotransferase subunit D
MKYDFGDKINIILKSDKEVLGSFVSMKKKDYIMVKLDSGYNEIVNYENVKEVELVEKFKPKKKKNDNKIVQSVDLPKIKLLHVGGTIASKVDYKTGAVSSKVKPKEILNDIPELSKLAKIDAEVVFNVLSGNIRFEHQNIIAKKILESLDEEISGIIISHGTDTLHYTSAALSFILQNIKVPVVLVGAQRSSDRPSSDAALNIISAAKFIVDQNNREDKFTGIFVAMHSSSSDSACEIFHGLNLKKLHTSRRDAFKQINNLPVAKYLFDKDKLVYYDAVDDKDLSPVFEPSFLNSHLKIGILKSHPNLCAEEILNFKKFDGLVIEGTGLGHLPVEAQDKNSSENKKIVSALTEVSKNTLIVISSQCVFGSTNLNVYSYGRILKDLSLLESDNMISETAFVKLAWLLSNFSKDEVKDNWNRNFVGEFNNKNIYVEEE